MLDSSFAELSYCSYLMFKLSHHNGYVSDNPLLSTNAGVVCGRQAMYRRVSCLSAAAPRGGKLQYVEAGLPAYGNIAP